MTTHRIHKYTFGNSATLPHQSISENGALNELIEHLKDVFDVPEGEPLYFVISTNELHPFQVSKIEHALMNPVPHHVV